MRTGISYQGKEVLAICLDDISSYLSSTPTKIRQAIKLAKMGNHNVAKDFVSANSNTCVVKRGVNSHSRKCTVIWLCDLPEDVRQSKKRYSQCVCLSKIKQFM